MSTTILKAEVEAADSVVFDREGAGKPYERHTTTVAEIGNDLSPGGMKHSVVAPIYVSNLTSVEVIGNQIHSPTLHFFNTRATGWANGGTLDVLRVVGGDVVEIGSHTVIDTVIHFNTLTHKDDQAVPSGVEHRYSLPDYHKPNIPIYFFVAELLADGSQSPWSDPLTSVVPSNPAQSTHTTSFVTPPKSRTGAFDNTASAPVGASLTTENSGKTWVITPPTGTGKNYIVGFSHYIDPAQLSYITVADASNILADDMIILRQTFDHTKTKDSLVAPRVWTSSVVNDYGMRGVGTFNETMDGVYFEFKNDSDGPYGRFTIESGKKLKISNPTHSGTSQNFYTVLVPGVEYAVESTLRSSDSLTAQLHMDDAITIAEPAPLTSSFTKFKRTFQVASTRTSNGARFSSVTVNGPGVVDVKGMAVFRNDTAPLDYSDEQKEQLSKSQMSYFRLHAFVKSKPDSFTAANMMSEVGQNTPRSNSLPQSFNILKEVNAISTAAGRKLISPWIQIPWHFTNAENAALGEYLYTPYDAGAGDTPETKPWAYLRTTQGQVVPWIDVFPNLRVELENENWNIISSFYTLPTVSGNAPGTMNGKYLDRLANALMASEGYNADKTNYYLGLWGNNNDWNVKSLAGSTHADFAGFANYNGGWDSGVTSIPGVNTPETYQVAIADSIIRNKNGNTRSDGAQYLLELCETASAGRAKPVRGAHYESGPGYVLNGLNGSTVTTEERDAQERTMKSVGVGTATLESFLRNAAEGVASNNFFLFQQGSHWSSHNTDVNGGSPYPSWQWLEFSNEHLIGEVSFLEPDIPSVIEIEGQAPESSIVPFGVQTEAGRFIVLCNLNVFKSIETKVKIKTPITTAGTRYEMTGTYDALNGSMATKDDIYIASTPLAAGFASTGQFIETVGPGKAVVIQLF